MSSRYNNPVALACALGLACLTSQQVQAQQPVPPDTTTVLAAPGTHPLAFDSVRVGMLTRLDATGLITRARAARVQGRFGDTLLVRGVKNRELLRIPPDRIEWMQVSTGRGWTRGGVTKGALIGVAGGFILATLIQHMSEPHENQTREGCPFTFSRECGRSYRLYGAGIALGAIAGASFAIEKGDDLWRFVRLPRR